jgi:hypothetical protein
MLAARHTAKIRLALCCVLSCLPLLLTACNTKTKATPENFIAGINAHFMDHPDCLFPESIRFPYETSDPEKTKQMNTLVASLLLTVAEEHSIHVSRYTVTDVGARVAPHFCYGHRHITEILSSTPPAMANGFPETQIVYRYSMEEVPVWAKSDNVKAAFPDMAHNISGTATGKATLAGTEAGWQVPD